MKCDRLFAKNWIVATTRTRNLRTRTWLLHQRGNQLNEKKLVRPLPAHNVPSSNENMFGHVNFEAEADPAVRSFAQVNSLYPFFNPDSLGWFKPCVLREAKSISEP